MNNQSISFSNLILFNISFPTRSCWLLVNTAFSMIMLIIICVILCCCLLLISHCIDISEWSISNRDYHEQNELDESVEFMNEISDVVMVIIYEGISVILYVCGAIICTFFTGLIINDTALLRWLIESILSTCLFTLFIWISSYIEHDNIDPIYSQLFPSINKLLSFIRLIMFIIMRCIDFIDVHTQWNDDQRRHQLIYCGNHTHSLLINYSSNILQNNKSYSNYSS
jgi:Na+/melibiose symporter-like transporter